VAAAVSWLRSVLYVAVSVAAMLAAALAGLPLLLVARPAAARLTRWFSGVMVRLLRAICGVEVVMTGLERLEGGPLLIAAKHQSSLETYLFAWRLPNAAFVLKREILMVPLVGWYVQTLAPIAVDRGAGAAALRSMLKRAQAAVAEGRDVVIFPEGTRTRPGQQAPYHPGVAALYGELGLPVVPVALDSGRLWPRRSLLKRPGRVTVAFLEPIPPGLPRRQFMALLQERIEAGCRALEVGGERS